MHTACATTTPNRILTTCTYNTNSNHHPKTPLVDAIVKRGLAVHEAPFHVPGHKRGTSTPSQLQPILNNPLQHDLTELPGLDYLSSPEGPILEAQKLAAQSFGAAQTWFLVNGTTVGIHAAVMATCSGGAQDALIIARNAHSSAFNAIVLTGCTPVWIQPEYAHGMAHHVTAEALEQGFERAKSRGLTPKAVLVVSPTYYGIISNIKALAEVCHANNAVLIVDEAHGSHLHLLPDSLSHCALQGGADIVVQSTHKQLSAMTQSAMLHLGRQTRTNIENNNYNNDNEQQHSTKFRFDPARISRALQILQTSSPSYLLMASLDAARAQTEQPESIQEPQAAAALLHQYFQKQEQQGNGSNNAYTPILLPLPNESASYIATNIPAMPHTSTATITSTPSATNTTSCARDPWRFTVIVSNLELTGWQAADILETQYNVVAEMANDTAVVFAIGMGSTVGHAEQLVYGLEQLKANHNSSSSNSSSSKSYATTPKSSSSSRSSTSPPIITKATPRHAFFASSSSCPIKEAVGQVAAELLCPYPPGVPAVYPGEVLTQQVVDVLTATVKAGGKVVGATDSTLNTIRVLDIDII